MTDVAEEVAGLNDTTTAGVGVLDEGLKGAGAGLAAVAEATTAGHGLVAGELAANRASASGFAADLGAAVAQAFGPLLAPIAGLQGAKGEGGSIGPVGPIGPTGKGGRDGTNGQDGAAGPAGPIGPEGEGGRDGAPGSQGVKGDKGLNWRGAFDGRISYQPDDAIEFQGSSFVAVLPIRGLAPPGNGWDLLARRGAQGPSGGSSGGGVALSNAVPLVESGSGAAGTGTRASKDDHVHPADGGGGGGSDDQTAAEVPFTPAGGIVATDVQAAIEEVAAEAGGLPPQWTDGGDGDVLAEVDDPTKTPFTATAPENGTASISGPGDGGEGFAIAVRPAGLGWTGAYYVDVGDQENLTGGGYIIRAVNEVIGRQVLDIDAWGSMALTADPGGGGGLRIQAGNEADVIAVTAGATLAASSISAFVDLVMSQVYLRLNGFLMSAPADGAVNNNEASIWFDPTDGAAFVNVKGKTADGTVVTGRLRVGATVQTYTESNVTTDRAFNANATSIDELADVLGTLIGDLRAQGLVA